MLHVHITHNHPLYFGPKAIEMTKSQRLNNIYDNIYGFPLTYLV
jgi:hypothetical protein